LIRGCALLLALSLTPLVAIGGPVPGGMGKPTAPPKPGPKEGLKVAPDEVAEFALDAKSKRNEVVFISKAPKETIKGKTRTLTGKLKGNLYNLTEIAGTFDVAWKDLDTGNKTRNDHMLAAPWVDASSHPMITFTLSGIEPEGKPSKSGKILKGMLIGKMAMNGREKELKIPSTIAYLPAGKSKSGKKHGARVSIKSKFDVELADFGIEGKGIGQAVSKTQNISVSLVMQPVKKEDSKSADSAKKKSKKKKKKTDTEA
jgi:polyisoprenoid-binding protein YceI